MEPIDVNTPIRSGSTFGDVGEVVWIAALQPRCGHHQLKGTHSVLIRPIHKFLLIFIAVVRPLQVG